MTQAPPPTPAPATVVQVAPQPTNGLGVAGFVVSLVGWLSCGVLSPIGLLLSLIALFKAPRGFAIAGAIIGGLGSLFLALFGIGLIIMVLGLGAVATTAVAVAQEQATLSQGSNEALAFHNDNGRLPTPQEFEQLMKANGIAYEGVTPRLEVTPPDGYRVILPGDDGAFGTADDESISGQVSATTAPASQPKPFWMGSDPN